MHQPIQAVRQAGSGASSPSLYVATPQAEQFVGQQSDGASELSDEVLASGVALADRLEAKYLAIWNSDGCFAAKGQADHIAAQRRTLIAKRANRAVAA